MVDLHTETLSPLQFVDSDNLLTNPRVLSLMMAENLTLVAPMLESRSLYSNFWCGISPQVQSGLKLKHVSIPLARFINWTRCRSCPSSLSGLLQANPRLSANQGVEAARLFPCSHGAQHLLIRPASGIQQGPGLLPSSPRLQLGVWWHHGVCFLSTSSRSVWELNSQQTATCPAGLRMLHYGFTVMHWELYVLV